jgi:RHH-type transcriptional regulator, rel operon repressor / antitoxin RelB
MLAVRLPKELEASLDRLALKTNRSKSYYVKKALESYLEEKAEYEYAAAAYREFLESGGETVSFEDVMKESRSIP